MSFTQPCLASSSRLVLGTAQLGMTYGIANKDGKPSQDNANEIVRTAVSGGVKFFDTAQEYGNSEEVLGKALTATDFASKALIISKLPVALTENAHKQIADGVKNSLEKLQCRRLYALLLHREEHLSLVCGSMAKSIESLIKQGIVDKFGVSVYTAKAAMSALAHPLVDVVQLPASLFDRRFEQAGVFDFAQEKCKEVHVRSVLLQGVLCMEHGELPRHLGQLQNALLQYNNILRKRNMQASPLALAWALRRYPYAKILFGAEVPGQVQTNLDFKMQISSVGESLWDELDSIIPPQADNILNPALWKIQ